MSCIASMSIGVPLLCVLLLLVCMAAFICLVSFRLVRMVVHVSCDMYGLCGVAFLCLEMDVWMAWVMCRTM